MVYAPGSRALAQLEKRVNSNGVAPVRQAMIRLDLPEGAQLLDVDEDLALQSQWRTDEGYTQGVGVDWLRSKGSLGLWVPSFIEPQERNLLINPAHRDYASIALVVEHAEFVFDPRLF